MSAFARFPACVSRYARLRTGIMFAGRATAGAPAAVPPAPTHGGRALGAAGAPAGRWYVPYPAASGDGPWLVIQRGTSYVEGAWTRSG
jgi:hypothetical protein